MDQGPLWRSKAALASLALHVGVGAAIGVSRGAEDAPNVREYEIEWWVEARDAAEPGTPPITREGEPDGESLPARGVVRGVAPAVSRVPRSANRAPSSERAPAKIENEAPVAVPAPESLARAPTTSSLRALTEPTFTRQSGPLSERDADQVPRLLGRVVPPYPRLALERGIEADVVLSLVVDERGRVGELRVLRGSGHGFDAAALSAAERLRFAPGIKHGQRVAVRVTWTCRFRLDG